MVSQAECLILFKVPNLQRRRLKSREMQGLAQDSKVIISRDRTGTQENQLSVLPWPQATSFHLSFPVWGEVSRKFR